MAYTFDATLEGKNAFVTGGASGIGLACAKLLKALGANVVIADIAPIAPEEFKDSYIATDVRDERMVKAMVELASKSGRLDIAVCYAGAPDQLVPTLEQDTDTWQQVLDVNVRGTYLCAREAGRVMLPGEGGSIITFASVTALGGFPKRNAYGTAKAGC